MNLTVLNDVHLGAVRTGGTTPTTALRLRWDLLNQFGDFIKNVNGDLMILGDLFDGPNISRADLLATFRILSSWLAAGPGELWLVNGNHDLSKDASNFSSFELLAGLLKETYLDRVHHVSQPRMIKDHDMYVIPHLPNQDLFNLALEQVPDCKYLAVHCNYDNHFAVASDHSLNLSREQAENLPVEHIIFAHEHQQREELIDKVVVIGNPWPSSVSDCLGNETKRALLATQDGLEEMQTWCAKGDYETQDWRSLDATSTCRFIRVEGTAEADEAAAVVTALARFRAQSQALVITNAVKVAGRDDGETLELSHDEITTFNVRAALAELLTPDENKKVNDLLEKKNAL